MTSINMEFSSKPCGNYRRLNQPVHRSRKNPGIFVGGEVLSDSSWVTWAVTNQQYGKSQFLMGKSTIHGHFP
jgi:hypothetical protein